MKKIIFAVMVICVAASGSTASVFAHGDHSSEKDPQHTRQSSRERIEESTQKVRDAALRKKEDLHQKKAEFKAQFKSQKEQILERKKEIKDEIESQQPIQKTALRDERLRVCQKRQDRINSYLQASSQESRQKLTTIQEYEKRSKEFYKKQSVVSAEFDAASLLVDEKEARALAAIEALDAHVFDCMTTDGNDPANEMKLLHANRTAALIEYRDNVKQIIQIIKNTLKAKAAKVNA